MGFLEGLSGISYEKKNSLSEIWYNLIDGMGMVPMIIWSTHKVISLLNLVQFLFYLFIIECMSASNS